jgi:hypothetical protein
MTTTIIGKHPSAYQHLHLVSGQTIGLNQAALAFKTDFAMSGHDVVIDMFKLTGFFPERTIACYPSFEGTNHRTPHWIKNGQYRQTIERKDLPLEWIENFVISAVNRDHKALYPNFWSILHLAMFYAVSNGATKLILIGVDNTPSGSEMYPDMVHHDYVRKHTAILVELFQKHGIDVQWFRENTSTLCNQ